MIFTDGVFHDERLALRLINKLKKNGVRVVAIGLGQRSQRRVAKKLLKSVASSKSDVYLISLSNNALLVEAELNEVVRHVQTLECIDKYRGKETSVHYCCYKNGNYYYHHCQYHDHYVYHSLIPSLSPSPSSSSPSMSLCHHHHDVKITTIMMMHIFFFLIHHQPHNHYHYRHQQHHHY